jgi:hypothetical protein
LIQFAEAPRTDQGWRFSDWSCHSFTSLIITLYAVLMPVPDKLVLRDGRVIEGCRVETLEQDYYVHFPHGSVRLPAAEVKEILVDSDADYRPRNEYERDQLEKGLLLFEGKWISKAERSALLETRRREREARLKDQARHLDWEHAWRRESPHFVIITNTSEELLEYYQQLFENFYRIFSKRWNIAEAKSSRMRKPVIKIYRSLEQYQDSGVPPRSSGLFDAKGLQLKLYHDFGDPRFTLDVLFHEGTHLMVHLLRPDFVFPAWLNEGLAEYYGASVLDEEGTIAFGQVQEGRLAVLRYALAEGEYIPLERVILTPQPSLGPIHYAEAWCLVHFLLEHKKYKSRFLNLFTSLASGIGLDEVVLGSGRYRSYTTIDPEENLALFKKKMGIADMTELEREYLEYIYYGLPDVGARGYLDSARIRIRDQDLDGALEDLDAALERGSRDAACFLYRARIHGVRGEYNKAAVSYMRALELDPLNPDYHLECGLVLRASEDRIMMEEGLRHIYLATEIEPLRLKFNRALERALSNEDLIELRKIKEDLKRKAEEGKKSERE